MATKNENFWFSLLGAALNMYAGNEEAKANNREYTLGEALGRGAIGAGTGYLLSEVVGESNDTVNYTYYNGKKRVYEGITREDRLDARIDEHERSGKKFTHVVYDDAKPRSEAIEIEKERIWKFQPKYNIHHNS